MEENIKIDKSKNVVIGRGNRVVQKVTEIYHALGKKQFLAIVVGLLLVLVLVFIAKRELGERQQLIYNSVNEVENELNALFLKNDELKSKLGHKQDEILTAMSDGIQMLKNQDYTSAIAKFKSIPKEIALAGVYNNIGYGYAKMDSKEQAETYFNKAHQLEPKSKAAEHNLKQLFAQAGETTVVKSQTESKPARAEPSPSLEPRTTGPVQPTSLPGVVAEITRFDNAGGMLTVEVTFKNSGADTTAFWVNPDDTYIIDEQTGKRWNDHHRGGFLAQHWNFKLKPGDSHVIWMKFLVEEESMPAQFTAVVPWVPRPFEQVALK